MRLVLWTPTTKPTRSIATKSMQRTISKTTLFIKACNPAKQRQWQTLVKVINIRSMSTASTITSNGPVSTSPFFDVCEMP